jgi:hypothetical protein
MPTTGRPRFRSPPRWRTPGRAWHGGQVYRDITFEIRGTRAGEIVTPSGVVGLPLREAEVERKLREDLAFDASLLGEQAQEEVLRAQGAKAFDRPRRTTARATSTASRAFCESLLRSVLSLRSGPSSLGDRQTQRPRRR